MKLKNIVLVLVPLLLVIILTTTIYTSFKGNPFKANRATKVIKEYVEKNYPEYELEVEPAKYNFKFESYSCKVYSKEIIDLHFTVKYNKKGNISYDSFEPDYLGGYNTLERWGEEYTTLVTHNLEELFGKDNINRSYIEYSKETLSGKAVPPKPDQQFDPNDNYNKWLMVNINGTSATPEDFCNKLKQLKKSLQEDNHYILNNYTLYIEIDGRAYDVRGIKPELINDDLVELIEMKAQAEDYDSVDVGFDVDVEE
jgi:hypothetical protein